MESPSWHSLVDKSLLWSSRSSRFCETKNHFYSIHLTLVLTAPPHIHHPHVYLYVFNLSGHSQVVYCVWRGITCLQNSQRYMMGMEKRRDNMTLSWIMYIVLDTMIWLLAAERGGSCWDLWKHTEKTHNSTASYLPFLKSTTARLLAFALLMAGPERTRHLTCELSTLSETYCSESFCNWFCWCLKLFIFVTDLSFSSLLQLVFLLNGFTDA